MILTVVLGPAPCHRCGALVVWGTVEEMGRGGGMVPGNVRRWRDPITGRIHRNCKRKGEQP